MRKKMMSVLLALAMVLTLLPATALAEGQTIYVNAAAKDDIAAGTAEDPYMTLQSAIAAASEGATIVLQSDLTVDSTASQNSAEIMISKALTLEGNGHKIIAGSFANGAHVVGVHSAAGAVTIQNLTIVGAAGAKHCLNVYQCTGTVTLNNVALMNSATAGLVINGSTVVANGLTTSGNAWGAVNVDNSSSFTLTSASSLAEKAQIWTEDSSTVNAAGYTAVTGGLAGDKVLKGFTYYTTDPAKLGAAQIGNHVYISLVQAISDVTDTAEIKLLNNVTITEALTINKSVVLDLGGHTMTITGPTGASVALNFTAGTSVVKNGQVIDERSKGNTSGNFVVLEITGQANLSTENVTFTTYQPDTTSYYNYLLRAKANASGAGSLTLGAGTVLNELPRVTTTAETTYGAVGVGVFGSYDNGNSSFANRETLEIKDGVSINTTGFAVAGNGTAHGTYFDIQGGSLISTGSTAIYHPQAGDLKISGNTIITGQNAGLEVRAGNVTISGGTISGLAIPTEVEPNGNGTTASGAGIAVIQHTTKLPINVTVTGGTINGYSALYEKNIQKNSAEDIAKVALNVTGGQFAATNGGSVAVYSENKTGFISGGTFTSNPSDYMAQGYKTYQANGTYKVVSKDSIIITFDSKGGSSVAPVATNAAGKLTTLPVPTLSGYVFSGWYTEDGVQVTADTVFTADTTVTAQWTYVPPYTPPTGGNTGNTGNTSTVTNPDGSTTTTVTKPDGTVTVTDKDTQGNVTETVSKPDGTSTTTVTTNNGSSSVTTMGQTGKVEAQVNLSQSAVNAADNEAVALPMASLPVTDSQAMAPVVTVDLPTGTAAAKVEVPVQNVTAGTVAILVKADGSQEIVKTSVTTESGVVLTVEDGAKVMIVDNSKDFADVPASYWGSDAVDFATSRDLFNGTSATTFDPDADMNRAMIVTVLARLEGVDTTTGSTWYEAGQQWAIEAGISDGSDLNSAVSREQLVTMLYRYAGSPAVSGVISGYADTDSVSSWAVEAMTWAINEGIVNGVGNSLDPQGDATRAQVATILMRFVATL